MNVNKLKMEDFLPQRAGIGEARNGLSQMVPGASIKTRSLPGKAGVTLKSSFISPSVCNFLLIASQKEVV